MLEEDEAEPATSVTVNNTASSPVPVTGSVTVSNCPTSVTQFRERVITTGTNASSITNATTSTLVIENVAVANALPPQGFITIATVNGAPAITGQVQMTVPTGFSSLANLQTKIIVLPGERLDIVNGFVAYITLTGHYEP